MQPKISLPAVLSQITQTYSPKLVASLDDNAYEVRIVKAAGPFIWHAHPDNDELFYVLKGSLTIEIEGDNDVSLAAGELFVVPKATRHRPVCEEAEIMVVEKAGVVNTGDAEKSDLTHEVEDVRSKVATEK